MPVNVVGRRGLWEVGRRQGKNVKMGEQDGSEQKENGRELHRSLHKAAQLKHLFVFFYSAFNAFSVQGDTWAPAADSHTGKAIATRLKIAFKTSKPTLHFIFPVILQHLQADIWAYKFHVTNHRPSTHDVTSVVYSFQIRSMTRLWQRSLSV